MFVARARRRAERCASDALDASVLATAAGQGDAVAHQRGLLRGAAYLEWLHSDTDVRPIAPLITGFQILQMVIGTCVVIYTGYMHETGARPCHIDDTTARSGLIMYGSYLILFADLFRKNYLGKGKRGAKGGKKQA